MVNLILYTILLVTSQASAHILVQEALKDHEALAKAVLYVTDHYIGDRTNTVNVMEMCKFCSSFEQNFHCRLLDYVLLNGKNSLTRLLYAGESDEQPWNYNTFIIDSFEAFCELVQQIKLNLYETQFYFLIALTHTRNLTDEQLKERMVKIVVSGLQFYVLNVVIMVENNFGEIVFYKSRIFGRNGDYEVLMTPFNHFSKGKLKQNFLFPYRTRNINNCTVRVALYELPPLLIFNGNKSNENHLKDSRRLEGIDGYLLRTLEEALNFRLEIIFSKERSNVFENGSTRGCFALLQNGSADVAVCNLPLWATFRKHFAASTVYHQSPIIVIIRSGLQYSALKQLACPFSAEFWNVIKWCLIIGIALIAFLRKCALENRFGAFNVIVIFLGMPARYLPRRHFVRLLFLCWIFFTFMLRNIYQGKMFDSLRIARRIPLPRSLEELMHQKYIMVLREYLSFYPRNYTWIVNEEYPERLAVLENADESVKMASISSIDSLAHYNRLNWNTSRLTMLNDPVHLFQIVMYFEKRSRFKFAIDEKLKQLMSAGIVSYITNKYIKRKFWFMNQDNWVVPQISNNMLYGLYIIYACLMGLAVIVFVLEISSRRLWWLRWVFWILRLIE